MQDMTEVTQGPLIVAVSGGVDSVVLLDMLAKRHVPLVIAHVNHGIRPDSSEDELLVRQLAKTYDFPFESIQLSLGVNAGEELARIARYEWLDNLKVSYRAAGVATAHHQDDVLETILINLVRGTGWRGLCSLRDTPDRYRLLLSMSKVEIVAYAIEHKLRWREDSTNESLRYLRNRIRHHVMPRLSSSDRRKLIELNNTQCSLRRQIDDEAQKLLGAYCEGKALLRYPLIMGDEGASHEVLRAWLGESLEKNRMRELLIFAKTAQHGAKWSLDRRRFVVADTTRLIVLAPRD